MNNFLTWGFVPLIIVGAFRVFLNKIHGAPWYDLHFLSDVEIYVYGICMALAIVSYWHNLVRDKCPTCRTPNPSLSNQEEIDRFVGTKEVNGRDGEGRRTTHHVSTTFVKMRYHYACSQCKREWHTVGKRELI